MTHTSVHGGPGPRGISLRKSCNIQKLLKGGGGRRGLTSNEWSLSLPSPAPWEASFQGGCKTGKPQ